MPKSERPKIPKAISEKVLKEFNYLCSVCATVKPQLHHIDEDRTNNDPLNLLPLCPNCHLIDQHNPTAPIDPGILSLFRRFKDPHILCRQFIPLFDRTRFIFEPDQLSADEIHLLGSDLIRFVGELNMGQYYAQSIKTFLGPQPVYAGNFGNQPESTEEKAARAREAEERRMRAITRLDTVKESVMETIVELLRYQDWPLPAKLRRP